MEATGQKLAMEIPGLSNRTQAIKLPIFREVFVLAQTHRAVNLAGGTPDFPPPEEIKTAAIEAIAANYNQYDLGQGIRSLREGIAAKVNRTYGVSYDPETEITITCGSTEAMTGSLLTVINPGDEVIIFEPAFPTYAAGIIISGGTPVPVKLNPPEFTVDVEKLAAAISPRTKAIILNSPHNPTGRVFSAEEVGAVADLCLKHNLLVIVDEIYDHLVYDGLTPHNIWRLPGMKERTIIVNGFSKTYSATGWRVGWVIAPAEITKGIKIIHNHMTLQAPTPLQMAAAKAVGLPASYYQELAATYQRRRDMLAAGLEEIGFECLNSQGGYFIVARFRKFDWQDDYAFARYLVEKIGVAAIPVSGFYTDPKQEDRLFMRFGFCKREETLLAALERLQKLNA